VREVERYQLDMVGLTSTHSTGSGTKLLERGWTLGGWTPALSPRLSTDVMEFCPVNERVASMRLQVAGGKALTVPTHRTAAQSIRPSWSPWVASWKGFHLGTP